MTKGVPLALSGSLKGESNHGDLSNISLILSSFASFIRLLIVGGGPLSC